MNKQYTVHGVNLTSVQTPATLPDGQVVTATVPALVVELVPVDASGTIKLVYTESVADAQALFAEGAAITVSFSLS